MPALLAADARRLNEAARAKKNAKRAAALAAAPVKAPDFLQRLDPSALEVHLDETLAFLPGVSARRAGELPEATVALAAHLQNAEPYGPVVRRAVRVSCFGGGAADQDLILVGRLSAVERTVPDRETRQAWAAAGVFHSTPGAPIVRQMEARPL